MSKKYYRKTATIVGALFIIATVTAIVSGTLLGTALDDSDYLLKLSENENEVIMAAIFELILAASLIGIGSLMFPILRKHVEGLALGYASIRLVEAIFIIIATICLLSMLSVSQGLVAGTIDAAASQPMNALLMALREWAYLIGTLLFLGMGALTLNYLLYRSELVPRWLSVWGLIGAVGVLMYGLMGLYGADTNLMDATTLMALPLAVQEMVFASWLIIKGFDTKAGASIMG